VNTLARLAAAFAATLLLSACGGGSGSSADAPPNFQVTAADSSVIATWTAEPDVNYWIFYGAGTGITTTNWATSGGRVITNATSPQIITGLTNDQVYSFTINGRKNGGPGGPGAPTVTASPRLAGNIWSLGPVLGTTRLRAVASGTVVAGLVQATVGEGGAIYTSVAGAATTQNTNPASPNDLYAIAFGAPGFVATGANGTILLGADGTNWTTTFSGTSRKLYGIASAVTQFVVVGEGGVVLTSSDGNAWTQQNSGTSADLYGVAWGNNLYVAVGAGGTMITSVDGITWSPVASGTTAALNSVALGQVTSGTTATNLWVAAGTNGTLVTSADGAAWTASPAISAATVNAIRWGGQFVAVGAGGTIFTSPDAVTWTLRPVATTEDLFGIARLQTGYSVVGDKGTTAFSS